MAMTPRSRRMLGGKIHRASVTSADLDYEGSVTVDVALLEAVDVKPYERVQVVDITNGCRLETYAMPGDRHTGVVQINGAAAHLVDVGDLVIIMSYVDVAEEDVDGWEPRVVHVDDHNRLRAPARLT